MSFRVTTGTKLKRLALTLVFLLMAVPCFGAINHVQQASNSDVSGAAYTSFSATFGSGATSGNTVVFAVTFGNTNPATITATDTQGNTYTQAIRTYDSGHRQGAAIFYSTNITGGASDTVTVQFSDSVAYLALGIHEYSGVATISALDGTSGNLNSGTALSSGSVTTTANGDLIFSVGVEDSTGTGDTFSPGSGFTSRVDLGSAAAYADEDQIQTSAGSTAGTWALSPSGLSWIADVAAFKASTVSGPTITSLSSYVGPVGTVLTITGTHFGATQGTSTVTFNGTAGAPCSTCWNDTAITVAVPSGATSGNVVVTVSGAASNVVYFTVGAIRHVQQSSNGDESGATYANFSATFGSATTSGNAIVLGLAYGNVNPAITVTDSQGNAYTEAIRTYDSGHSEGCSIFYSTNITGGSSNTVSVHFASDVAYLSLGIHEYAGIRPLSALDGTSGNMGNGSPLSSGVATTTTNGDLIFACGVEDSVSGGDTFTPGSGFAKRVDLGTDTGYADEDRIQPYAGSIAAGWTMAPDLLDWIVDMAAFKPADNGTAGAPHISNLSPAENSIGGLVTITGTNFGASQGTSTVTFNGSIAAVTTSSDCPAGWSSTCIAVTVPSGATTGNVVVTVSGVASNGVAFTVVVNQPPTVSAGANQTIELPVNVTTLQGSATSTVPPNSPVSVLWTQDNGPSGVIIASPTSAVTTATFPGIGTYVLRLTGTVIATGLSSSATVTIVVAPINQPPVVNAGPNQSITLPTVTTTLNGSVSDDGNPPSSSLVFAWTKVAGPGSVAFSNPASLNTQVTFPAVGTFILRLSANDGQFVGTSDVTVTVAGSANQGLVVNAGPNQIVVYPAQVTLVGAVTDTLLPSGGTLTSQWTQVSGPGTASFTNPTSPSGAVTFDKPGVYDLRLSATDGVQSGSSDVFIFLGHLECTRSNNGTDFWLMFISGLGAGGITTNFPRQMSLSMSGVSTTTGTVSIPGIGFSAPFSVTPGQVTTVNIPDTAMITTTDQIESKGIHVTSQQPVAVYGLNYIQAATDGYTGLPTPVLGTNYVSLGYQNTYNAGRTTSGPTRGTEFGVTATQDNTQVTITPATSTTSRKQGVPYTITLNQGQTYQLYNTTDGPGNDGAGTFRNTTTIDLSGSLITSNKPIAVFGGHDCTEVPSFNAACNHLVEEMPPTNLWGEGFVTMPIASQTAGDTFRYLASANNTHVTVNGQLVATLSQGQYYEQVVTVPSFISADQPILVAQYSNSDTFSQGFQVNSLDGPANTNLDPSMTLIPPFEQFGGTYTVSTPATVFNSNYINVVAPASVVQSTGVLLDGVAIPASLFVPIQSSGFSGAQVPVTVGSHTLTSAMPFGIWSYGFAYFDQYSYTGGMCSANGAQSGALALTPSTGSVQRPQSFTVSAHFTDAFGNTAGGIGVDFSVSGANSLSSQVLTDANGNAVFTYAGSNTGSDVITASVSGGGATSSANVTWLPAGANQAPHANAGPDQSIELPADTVLLLGSAPDDGLPIGSVESVQWSTVSGPASVTFTTPAQLSTTAAFSAPGTYVLQLAANDTQLTGTGTVTITVYPVNQAPTVYAGADQTIQLPTNSVTLQGTASDDQMPPQSSVTTVWTQLSGPGAATIATPGSLTTGVTLPAAGIYVFQLQASDTKLTSSSTVTITLHPADVTNRSPVVNAGSNQTIQLPTSSVTLSGTATDDGFPSGATLTILWQKLSGPGTVTFSTPNQAVTQATFSTVGSYVVQLSANDTQFTSTSAVVVTVLAADVPPVVSAGVDQAIELPTSQALLNGSVFDNTLPPNATLTITWSKLSGPAAVSFTTPSNAVTLANFTTPGTYVLQLLASDGTLSSSSSTTVTVYPVNQAPTVNAGSYQPFVYVPYIAQTLHLTGTATDDHYPAGSTLAVQWTQLGGPGPVTFSNPNAADTTANFVAGGTYLLQLSATDGQYTSVSVITINAPALVIGTGGPYQAYQGVPIQLNGSITANGQDEALTYPFAWQAEQAAGTVNAGAFGPNTAVRTFTFGSVGDYTMMLCHSVPAGCDTRIAQLITIHVQQAPGTVGPALAISSLTDGSEVTKPTPVIGTVPSGNWTLSYQAEDDSGTQPIIAIGSGSTPVTNGTLGTFDPTLLLNGTYDLILETADPTTGIGSTVKVPVSVTRNMKVGVFSLSFNDLTVPAAGIPIQIIRSYSSIDTGVGDFGVGWRLSLGNVHVQRTHNAGLNWFEQTLFSGFLPEYCLQQTNPSMVTITFAGTKTYRFQESVSPSCQLAGPITNPTVTYVELPGAAGTNGATLAPKDGGHVLVDGSIPGPVNLVDFNGSIYNPSAFILTTLDGTKYALDLQLGLTSVTDANGNTITIGTNGIISSTGKSVAFVRDEVGRITTITDPDGHQLHYVYNDYDHLGSFIDGAGNVLNYGYDGLTPTAKLTGITDGHANTILGNNYDGIAGRLLSTSNGDRFSTTFTHNLAAQTETIKDANGLSTTYAYDADGNIIQTTDPLGHITSATYDADDNKLTETNALHKTTTYTYDANDNRLSEADPLGNTTHYTYNSFGKPLTIEDPNHHITTNTYDPATGNLLTTVDALGNTTTNTYNLNGTLDSTQDALHHTTHFHYDSSGNLASQVDANNVTTTYTYDANGNRASQSVTRTTPSGPVTQTTQYQYDGENRLIKTINPDSTFTQVGYTSLGLKGSTTDGRGNTTTYNYDLEGHPISTIYPDGTQDSSTYDAAGRRIFHQIPSGDITRYTYDNAGRITLTNDGITGATTTVYDDANQVTSTTDARSNTTHYEYDDAGRRKKITDALGHITSFEYDAAGNQASVTDALTHTTTYAYDELNRQKQVTYADLTFDTTGYDAVGRVIARTDANGKTTQYGYDNVGRLTSVTDAATQVTHYGYDEVGNRISQTDAKNHTTAFQYDGLGRRIGRTLPAGQSESFTYDANGNVHTHTDFNGKTTTYTYDAGNRLTSKIPDPSFNAATIVYRYNATTGLRISMIDGVSNPSYFRDGQGRITEERGNTADNLYTYDVMGHLATLGGPQGQIYSYDALNRLSSVRDASPLPNMGTVTYGYDAVGNLTSRTLPNGVVQSYTYDAKNRLTNTSATGGSGANATNLSYTYAVDNAGHRTGVSEQNGAATRTVSYSYDNLYRLTNETIAGDTHGNNGSISYTYDPVGNRTQQTSTSAAITSGTFGYDADDRLTTDVYDANGNTTNTGGQGITYNFENRILTENGATYVYDGDGNRVEKTVGGHTTVYAITSVTPGGYPMVGFEQTSQAVPLGVWLLGLQREAQLRQFTANNQSNTEISYFIYDGHGSTRALTDPNGNLTDAYDYDAFGNLIHTSTFCPASGIAASNAAPCTPGSSPVPTPNEFLFAGEQFDAETGHYYNRARYLNTTTGRFMSMDTYEGDSQSPASLHKYLYTADDPVDRMDPSGRDFDLATTTAVSGFIGTISGAIVGGITGGTRGAIRGAVEGAVFGAAFPVGGAGIGTALLGNAARGVFLVGLGGLIGSTGVSAYSAVTAQSANERNGALASLILSAAFVAIGPRVLQSCSTTTYQAEQANATFAPDYVPPYAPGTEVTETTAFRPVTLVRVYTAGTTNPVGVWLADPTDVNGFTPDDVQSFLSLPFKPTHVEIVTVPAGTTMRVGFANPDAFGGVGYGLQYQLLNEPKGSWFGPGTLF